MHNEISFDRELKLHVPLVYALLAEDKNAT